MLHLIFIVSLNILLFTFRFLVIIIHFFFRLFFYFVIVWMLNDSIQIQRTLICLYCWTVSVSVAVCVGIPSSQRTVAFEKACILFNLAGVYTQIATKQNRGTEKGLDIAVDNFLRAAGIFKHIHETFTNAPSVDLKPQFLEILVSLMLAQARECLYEKLLLQIETFSISNKNHVSESRVVCYT